MGLGKCPGNSIGAPFTWVGNGGAKPAERRDIALFACNRVCNFLKVFITSFTYLISKLPCLTYISLLKEPYKDYNSKNRNYYKSIIPVQKNPYTR